MSRLRCFRFSSKTFVQKFLCRQTISGESYSGILWGNVSRFQRALFHFSRNQSHSSAAYFSNNVRRFADFAPTDVLLSRRFIHATGASRFMERDHYEILGVSKDATRDEIKNAFHALAKKYHPDANRNNPSAKRKFQEIRDAYETLQDPEKKAQYDMRMRGTSRRAKNSEYRNRERDHYRYAHTTQFTDSFHKIFAEILENETGNVAADIQVELELSFSEAAKGCIKHLSFDADVPCDSCYGRGHALNAETKLCPTCRGSGRVTMPPFTTTCFTCKGSGWSIKVHCMTCKGSGVCEGVRNVKVSIPSGVDSGDTIRVSESGNAGGWGKSPGDLFIKLKVAEDPIFSRQGADIYVNSYISFTQAILGGNIEVPTLSGKMQLRIPKGVQHGQLVPLRGKGLPKNGFFMDHGDQYVRFCINFPSIVTERQRAILEEFEEEIIDENDTLAGGSWWQFWVKRVPGLEFSVLMLITLIILGKLVLK